jgi:hypothetical protein
VDPDTVKFKDKAREKQRQRTLAERAKTREAAETAEAAEETEKQARRDKYREEREKEAKRQTAAKRRLVRRAPPRMLWARLERAEINESTRLRGSQTSGLGSKASVVRPMRVGGACLLTLQQNWPT